MKKILSLKKYIRRYIVLLILGVIAMLFFAIFNGLNVTAIKPILDFIFAETDIPVEYSNLKDFATAIASETKHFFSENSLTQCLLHLDNFKGLTAKYSTIMERTDSKFLLLFISVLMTILFTLKNVFFFLQRTAFINFRGKIARDIRFDLYKKYLNQSLTFFSENQVGDAIVRLVSDVNIVNDKLIMASITIFKQLITVAFLVRLAIYLNSELFVYSLLILPLISFTVGKLGKKIKKYAKRIQKHFSSIFSNVEESLNNIRIVKAFAKEKEEIHRFKTLNDAYFMNWKKSQIYSSLNVPIGEINSVVTGLIILLIGGNQILNQTSTYTFGDFLAFLLVVFSMMHPLKDLGKSYSNLKKAQVSLDRLNEVLLRENEIEEKIDAVPKNEFHKEITFDNVHFSYDGKKNVLQNINLKIPKGKSIAFVGSSGSGKTTLINLITRMYDVSSGAIKIDGTDIRDIKLKHLRHLFGTVTQDAYLFSKTIRENIEYGLKDDSEDMQIRKALEIAYAEEFVDKLPNKTEERLLSKGANFSGGQKQRLCIARAIIGNPPIIIFDEATSALDTESEQKVQKAIEKATRNRTVLMIAHRLSTVLKADKIVVMDQGNILAEGKHSDLLKSCPRYKELYDIQFNSHKDEV